MDGSKIFRKSARERLSSPDDLDKYLRVTNPGAWIIVLSIIALIIGVGVWIVFGDVSSTVEISGVMHDDTMLVMVDRQTASRVNVGEEVLVSGDLDTEEGLRAQVSEVASVPYDRDEVLGLVGREYLVETLIGEADWGYPVSVAFEDAVAAATLESDVPLDVVITTEHISPFQLLFGD